VDAEGFDAQGLEAQRAETYLRLMAEAALRHATGPEPDSVWQYLGRVRYVGTALVMLGILDEARAERIADDLEAAVAIRSGQHQGSLVPHRLRPGPVQHVTGAGPAGTAGMAGPRAGVPAETGPMRAVPVGQVFCLRNEDMAADLWLLSLVQTPVKTLLGVTGWISQWSAGRPLARFGRIWAVDDRGNHHVAFYSGNVGQGHAVDGWLHLGTPLAADTRWIDLCEDPAGEALIRVRLGAGAAPGRVIVEPAQAVSPAERLLDAVAEGMLARLPEPGYMPESPDELVAALEAAGALAPDSPATGRLAGLCQRAGLDAGHALVAAVTEGRRPAAELPAPWTSLLAYFGRRHRPAVKRGVAPAALVLPELDGVRFILAGLRSDSDHTLLSVVALGLPPDGDRPPFGLPWIEWFPWWLRDSAGQWHLAGVESYDTEENGLVTLGLGVIPPLARPVTRLEVIISGRAARVRATVRVNWVDDHD
jgi:hypothetical protein